MSDPLEDVLRVLDDAAHGVSVDDGVGFVAENSTLLLSATSSRPEWFSELENVLWHLEDNLDVASLAEGQDLVDARHLVRTAAIEWLEARRPGGEGAEAYARRWAAFIGEELWGPETAR